MFIIIFMICILFYFIIIVNITIIIVVFAGRLEPIEKLTSRGEGWPWMDMYVSRYVTYIPSA